MFLFILRIYLKINNCLIFLWKWNWIESAVLEFQVFIIENHAFDFSSVEIYWCEDVKHATLFCVEQKCVFFLHGMSNTFMNAAIQSQYDSKFKCVCYANQKDDRFDIVLVIKRVMCFIPLFHFRFREDNNNNN